MITADSSTWMLTVICRELDYYKQKEPQDRRWSSKPKLEQHNGTGRKFSKMAKSPLKWEKMPLFQYYVFDRVSECNINQVMAVQKRLIIGYRR